MAGAGGFGGRYWVARLLVEMADGDERGVVCVQSVGFCMRSCGRISGRAGFRCYMPCLARCVEWGECAWAVCLSLVDASTIEG